jgi:glycosyltransferase involved in cell wall biosynthesis
VIDNKAFSLSGFRPLVVIPSYKLDSEIVSMIDETLLYVPKDCILVIDDGSPDDTFEMAKSTGVRVIRHHTNCGKGKAIRTALAFFIDEKSFDSFITIDGDRQHPPEYIVTLLKKLAEGYDVVMGNRMSDTSSMPGHRVFSNRLSSWGISVVLRENIPDSQCGFRGFRRWVIEKINPSVDNYAIESEIALQSGFLGAKIGFVEIPAIYDGQESHLKPLPQTINITKTIVKYFIKDRFGIKGKNGKKNIQ